MTLCENIPLHVSPVEDRHLYPDLNSGDCSVLTDCFICKHALYL